MGLLPEIKWRAAHCWAQTARRSRPGPRIGRPTPSSTVFQRFRAAPQLPAHTASSGPHSVFRFTQHLRAHAVLFRIFRLAGPRHPSRPYAWPNFRRQLPLPDSPECEPASAARRCLVGCSRRTGAGVPVSPPRGAGDRPRGSTRPRGTSPGMLPARRSPSPRAGQRTAAG